ncbi:MAG: hypothetical protein Q4C56_02710 [Peptococcaceae bacterium]|nr:hypothetical protein [Peptococcaceae bacterium]
MVAFRDLKVSMDIAKMAELGKFEQEYIVYGCCYMAQDKRHYYISNHYEDVSHFIEEALATGRYPSPPVEYLDRVLVPSGMDSEYANIAKWRLAKRMRASFDPALIVPFQEICATAPNNTAAAILAKLQKDLAPCFDSKILTLAQGLATLAYEQKKIDAAHYRAFGETVADHFRQMADDTVVKKEVRRTLYGFGCELVPGRVKYYCNAYASEIYKRRDSLLKQHKFCTPVISETYYFDQMPDMSAQRKRFMAALPTLMDAEYWQLARAICQCPSPIDGRAVQALYDQAPDATREWLDYYLGIWQV